MTRCATTPESHLRRLTERRYPARARQGIAMRNHAGCRAQGCRAGFSSRRLLLSGSAEPCDAIVASRQAKRASRKQLCNVGGVRKCAVVIAFQLKQDDMQSRSITASRCPASYALHAPSTTFSRTSGPSSRARRDPTFLAAGFSAGLASCGRSFSPWGSCTQDRRRAPRACSRSACKSSADSNPIDNRTIGPARRVPDSLRHGRGS